MNINEMTTAQLDSAIADAHAFGTPGRLDYLELAREERVPNSHFCPTCHALTDGGPCPHHNIPTELITMGPGIMITD